jgi:hypothetical protein
LAKRRFEPRRFAELAVDAPAKGVGMTKTCIVSLVIAVVVSLVIGLTAGFFLGIASTKAGKAFLSSVLETEQKPDVSHPKTVIRDRFQFQYPSNWNINSDDEGYDPDGMFSIHSPGTTFVMFVIMPGTTAPEDSLRTQIRPFENGMNASVVGRFEKYGSFTGKGAILKTKTAGSSSTTKLFSFCHDGLRVMITQFCPDSNLKRADAGLSLIENSFSLRTAAEKKDTSGKPDASHGK